MKKIVIAALGFSFSLGLVSCGGAKGDDPGHSYMPDMYYSRAYEAYGYNDVGGERDSLAARGISYNALLVPGTVARGDLLPYHLTSDSAGLKAADALKNPTDSSSKKEAIMKEAERLYLVNCGICHGPALDGNGPLYKGGDGPYPAAPRPLNGDYAKNLSDGSIYYTITFGKNAMGSYASQLRPEQRWMVINYIRSKQGGAASDSTAKGTAITAQASMGSAATTDSTKKAKP
ncbi:c-type cytochrome [Flavisolibacter ginsenosidimutans]|uniref:Cytochrome c n=1 Tax=Flavisolibacter ginsenosidimutans TaxID=661481 RepID=A0A5B8UMS4_9BACT|nr:cytochrome c [Flavisolibacter ginsenosidimutans]QEC57370.1 cytochrome c [Flavisolibacter ginsenosidimutans]